MHGAADARLLMDFDYRVGASGSVDLWWGDRLLYVGGVASVGALSRGAGNSSQVFAPVGLSLGLLPPPNVSGPNLVLRSGVYAGAVKGEVFFHGWAAAAVGYRFALGEGASVRTGVDLWALFGDNGILTLSPYLGLGW